MAEHLLKHFKKIGARLQLRPSRRSRGSVGPDYFAIDVGRDRGGEYFEITRAEDAPELDVLQVVPRDRHLLLYSRDGQRFLCGHDERHWFVAAVADRVSTVHDAKRSIMPRSVREEAERVAPRVTDNRKNPVFKRQGEWFFIPMDEGFRVSEGLIYRNEPLQRTSRSKPHVCDELYRTGGRQVYVVPGRVMGEAEYLQRKRDKPKSVRYARPMRANPDVYVRGFVRHPDHATIRLDGWHRVYINGEITSQASSVTFLD